MGKETISRTTLVKGVTACVVVAASLGIIQIGEYSINSSEEAAGTAVSSTTGAVAYTPGTYTATAAGIQSDVTVTCTFDEGSITAITVDVSGETAGLGADIGDEMIESFLAAQGSAVDGVSGATITSDALKAALEDCIAQATGGSDSSDEADVESTEDSSESDEEAAESAEAASEADEDAVADTEADSTEGAAESADDASETETESEADSEVTAAASNNTASSSGSGTYTPGTYTATAAGMESDVKVTITVDETSILSLGIDVSGETADIGAATGPEISEQILNAQSADVDGVSGATVTSTAVKTALADALDQAAGGSSDSSDDTDTADVTAEEESEAAETDAAEAETAEIDTEGPETDATEIETEAPETDAAEIETEAPETDAAEIETEAPETDAAEIETEDSETDAAAKADISAAAEIETESKGTEAEPAETETEAVDEPSAIEGEDSFVPGTYTASAAGISSDVTVTCTFDETGLVSVEADVSGETSGIGADIGDTMIARVLEAQSSDVDGVSGATITSDAFKAAVADCMEQAGFVAEAAETEAETESESAAEAESTDADESDTELAAAADAPFVPGTYTATAQGMESEITVNVTFDEYNIVAVGTWLEGETAGVGADIGEEISNQILEAQSADVDGVSGATVTSTAVREAVAACIEQAKADNDDAASVDVESEAENITEEVTEAETEVITEEVTEAVLEEETETAADGSRFFAGTYTASAAGINSDVTVTIIVDDNNILSVGYDVSGETAGIGADIGPEISGQILAAQSAEVDGISGATVTSDAFKTALADCIAQAEGSGTAEAEIDSASGEKASETETESDVEEVESEDTNTAATESVDNDEAEVSEEASFSSLYSAGVYTASAAGISSDVVVTVSFDDNSITSIGYDLSGETADIGALIGPEISGQILTAQSAEVDGVSGATVTSDAFKAAVADCIAQAQAGSSDLVIIGGSDGPTSIFLAGTVSEDETEQSETEDAE